MDPSQFANGHVNHRFVPSLDDLAETDLEGKGLLTFVSHERRTRPKETNDDTRERETGVSMDDDDEGGKAAYVPGSLVDQNLALRDEEEINDQAMRQTQLLFLLEPCVIAARAHKRNSRKIIVLAVSRTVHLQV
jgi:hypothetical protein